MWGLYYRVAHSGIMDRPIARSSENDVYMAKPKKRHHLTSGHFWNERKEDICNKYNLWNKVIEEASDTYISTSIYQ